MKARRKVVPWGTATILALSILVALAQQHSPPAQAQAADDEAQPAEPPPPSFEPPVIGPVGEQRFSLAPSDPGALTHADLSDLEKEAMDVAASIHEAEHPAEAVAGWSAISRQAAEQAAIRRAEYEAGIRMADLGVE